LIPIFAITENGETILHTGETTPFGSNHVPLFYALPAMEVAAVDSLTGTWKFDARMNDEGEVSFELRLLQRGDGVEGRSDNADSFGSGVFVNDRLDFKLTSEGHTYRLTGRRSGQTFSGEWKQLDDAAGGTWSARKLETVTRDDPSPAVVALYEYRRKNGTRFYSTNPQLSDGGAQRSAEPLCRVWRNPMNVLVLDPEAQPVLDATK
jgi:hypothetical protein